MRRLAEGLGVAETTARILVARGIDSVADAREFLEPDLGREWLDPSLIPGMDEAAGRVAEAVRTGERILVFGDFDLDGVSAAAVMTRGLILMGGRAQAIVPHRFREGYGLSQPAIERVLRCKPDLVVTVDCGISSGVEVEMLRGAGVDVVVTDHHEPGDLVPSGIPVANPKLDPGCPSSALAGAGVALKLVDATGRLLGAPDVWRSLVDLATLGTVADIVPLVGENRALVHAGVESVRSGARPAIAELCAVADVAMATFTSESLAFALAPRLNAAGRMDDPSVALDLLLADDPVRAHELAARLDSLNRERQSVELDLSDAASALAERVYAGERALVLAGEGWHEGVKGIVASRLTQRYAVPTFLFTIENGVARGSARSVGAVDLFKATEACADVLDRFGGHAAAVGLSLPESNLERFRDALLAYLMTLPEQSFVVDSPVDADIELGEIGVELGSELARLAPFGHSNPKPMLRVHGAFMADRRRVGKTANHLRFTAFDGASSVPAIAFRVPDIEHLDTVDEPVDLIFELDVDEWRGRRRAQMLVRDVIEYEHVAPDGPAAELVAELFEHADEIIAREEYAGITDAGSFHTKLAGVTFEGRPAVVSLLRPGMPLRIVRQPDNPHDASACAVFDPHGEQVGFLNRRLAAVMAPVLDAGVEYDAEVSEVTGGEDGRSLGVNVLIIRRDLVESDDGPSERREQARAELSALPADRLERELVARFIGDRSLHAAQSDALERLASGIRTLVVMATGRGKSLIFHLHAARIALLHGRASVFVFPLRALVSDQAFHLEEAFAQVGLSVRVVTGETSATERDSAYADLADGSLDVVLTTPEFLHIHSARFAESGRVGFVVVDEAHHVGQSRAGNRPAYAKLGDAIDALGSPDVLAVTATASDDVADRIRETLAIGSDGVVLDPTVRENLRIEDHRGLADKDGYIARLVAGGGKCVIYVNSRDASVRLARMLRKRVPALAWSTAFYNGGLSRSVRHAVEHAFRTGEVKVVVATSAFGEGVNIPDIRDVVLYHLPFSDVEFNQMAGRAGRDGALSRIHLLFGPKDARINQGILSTLAPSREDLATLYRVLSDLAGEQGDAFEVTNAELAERCAKREHSCRLDDRGVSSGLGIFRELGFVTGEGHGAYRRLMLVRGAGRMELTSSARYSEGLDEIAGFAEFRDWVLGAASDDLLLRFNRPILPTRI